MRSSRRQAGFTLVELLGALAILIVLFALVAVNVISYQRTMEQFELDGTAKEIYVAAQNHLTMAKSLGLLDQKVADADGNPVDKYAPGKSLDSNKDIFYFIYPGNTFGSDSDAPDSILDLMLPFAAIDETVRQGNSFVIRYQRAAGRVLDVFYSKPQGRFEHSFTADELARPALLTGQSVDEGGADGAGSFFVSGDSENMKSIRRDYGDSHAVLGWYGGDPSSLPVGKKLEEPKLTIHNKDILYVEIENPNTEDAKNKATSSLKLVITGVTSKAQKAIALVGGPENGEYKLTSIVNEKMLVNDAFEPGSKAAHYQAGKFYVVLDDITAADRHFSSIFASADNGKNFIAGEDLRIEAIAYDNTKLTNVASSGNKVTNSLFESVHNDSAVATNQVARIGCVRHLENLDKTVSKLGKVIESSKTINNLSDSTLRVAKAEQIADLDWNTFLSSVASNSQWVYSEDPANANAKKTTEGTYKPVALTGGNVLEYEGNRRSIKNVKASGAGMAGLFEELPENAKVSNLELVDFSIASSDAEAGALAGKATKATITNVLAHHTVGSSATSLMVNGQTIAGGLVGSMTNGSITNSASSLLVQSGTSSAGGLVGDANGVTITGCYSGGHTNGIGTVSDSQHPEQYPIVYSATDFNVTSTSGVAGGLVGNSAGCTINQCYSTCSVKGKTNAGGFVGTSSGTNTIDGSYCTGLVDRSGSAVSGAFAGDNGSSITGCWYFSMINPALSEENPALTPVAGNENTNGVTAFDSDMTSYANIAAASATPAVPYDQILANRYKKGSDTVYPFKTVSQLGANGADTAFVANHYGDWPAPETLVVNVG